MHGVSHKSTRFWFLVIFCVIFVVVITVRLLDIQLRRGHLFRQQADDNRFFSVRVPPARGILLDRYQEPLVWNVRTYFKLEESTESAALQRSRITREEALTRLASPSASLEYGLERQYRYPEALAHVLGYVGPVTADDLLADDSLVVSDQVGKIGLEQTFDQDLRGLAGTQEYEINAMGKRLRVIREDPGAPGQSLTTTLDPYLSQVAWEALGEQRGSVVIMDAGTGQVLTLVNKPSYDPNTLTIQSVDPQAEQQRRAQVSTYFTDPNRVFFNRAVSGAYPPGSVFKLITATAGLEKKAFDASTSVIDEGVLKVGEFSYANWYFTQYGRTEGEISVRRAIARSNDIFFYKAAEWTGPDQLASFARMFGLGQVTGIELGSEAKGLVPDPGWKQETLGEPWYLGNTYHFGIGQGDVLVTPLQIARMTQALGNDGVLCRPTVMSSPSGDCASLGLAEDHAALILGGMLDACSTGGTAFPFFPYNVNHRTEGASSRQDLENGAIACKTGTAEFGGQDEQGHRKTHAWFTAILGAPPIATQSTAVATASAALAPTDSATASGELRQQWLGKRGKSGFPQRLIITVMVESDEANKFKEGSRDAAPVAKTIVDWMEE